MRYIEQHIESLNAVLILAFESYSVWVEYTFSTLSAIFPKTLVNNIAFISPLSNDYQYWIFSRLKVPEVFKRCPVFYLDNPIKEQDTFGEEQIVCEHLEHRALNMLLALFNWLGYLKPQSAKEIVSVYEKYQNIEAKTITILDQRAREVEIDRLITRLKKHSAVSLPIACI